MHIHNIHCIYMHIQYIYIVLDVLVWQYTPRKRELEWTRYTLIAFENVWEPLSNHLANKLIKNGECKNSVVPGFRMQMNVAWCSGRGCAMASWIEARCLGSYMARIYQSSHLRSGSQSHGLQFAYLATGCNWAKRLCTFGKSWRSVTTHATSKSSKFALNQVVMDCPKSSVWHTRWSGLLTQDSILLCSIRNLCFQSHQQLPYCQRLAAIVQNIPQELGKLSSEPTGSFLFLYSNGAMSSRLRFFLFGRLCLAILEEIEVTEQCEYGNHW